MNIVLLLIKGYFLLFFNKYILTKRNFEFIIKKKIYTSIIIYFRKEKIMKSKIKNQLLDRNFIKYLLGISIFSCGLFTLTLCIHIAHKSIIILISLVENHYDMSRAYESMNIFGAILLVIIFWKLIQISRSLNKNPVDVKNVNHLKSISNILIIFAIYIQLKRVIFDNNAGFVIEDLLSPITMSASVFIAFALIMRIMSQITNNALRYKEDNDYTI